MGKYDPLKRFLLAKHEDSWRASFAEIEVVLGFTLPPSAQKYPAWWSNNPGNVATNAWLDADWRTEGVDVPGKKVTFIRISSSAEHSANPKTAADDDLPFEWDKPEELKCALELVWTPIGRVSLDNNDRLILPVVPKIPGLYRFRIGEHSGAVYVGETDNLRRRFGNYRNPGPSQQTSLRINRSLREGLKSNAEIGVAVVTETAWLSNDIGRAPVDLSIKSVRRMFENFAMSAGLAQDIEQLNR